jgi:hypothetical protein
VESAYTLSPTLLQYDCHVPGCGVGIAQWDNKYRWPRLVAWANRHSYSGSQWNYMVQVEYVLYELSSNYPHTFAALKSNGSVKSATDTFMNGFEGPKTKDSQQAREQWAQWALTTCG